MLNKQSTGVMAMFGLALFGCVTTPLTPPPGKALYDAVSSGNVQNVTELLNKGEPIDQDYYSWTPLCSAAYAGHFDVVKLLLDRGARNDVNRSDERGPLPTALSCAANGGHLQIVKLLIEHGADVQVAIEGLERSVAASIKSGTGNPAIMTALNESNAGLNLLERMRGKPADAEVARSSSPSVTRSVSKILPILAPNFSGDVDAEAYAVIVGIENYADLPAAIYAERDAFAAKEFIRALGVPERNIMLLAGNRATKTGMEKALEAWLPNNVTEKSRVFFYYSGHGAPDTKTGAAYLVPSDGDPQYLAQTGYPLKRLYAKLGDLKAKSVLVALDSCFSGTGGRSVLAKGTRPLVGKVNIGVQSEGRISVISASAGDQVSGANDDVGYGLFTYNLLQGLNGAARDSKGSVTLKSLYSYVKPRVQDEARRGNRDQTPQLQNAGVDEIVLRSK